jgi:hypothetical protein
MLKKITKKIKELGINIEYCYLDKMGYFGLEENKPIIFINEKLN